MAKKKVTTTTTTVVTETIDDGVKRPFHAMVLIDNSGSMAGWQQRVVTGVNEYVNTLKKSAKEGGFIARVTVQLFDGDFGGNLRIATLRESRDVQEWAPVTLMEIAPNGSTPLYDAVNRAIDYMNRAAGDSDKALVVLTDGGENSSKTAGEVVRTRIATCQASGWLVIYLGANQDAWNVGGSMGFSAATTSTYTMDNMGVAFASAARSTADYASTRSLNAASFTSAEIAGMSGKKEEEKKKTA